MLCVWSVTNVSKVCLTLSSCVRGVPYSVCGFIFYAHFRCTFLTMTVLPRAVNWTMHHEFRQSYKRAALWPRNQLFTAFELFATRCECRGMHVVGNFWYFYVLWLCPAVFKNGHAKHVLMLFLICLLVSTYLMRCFIMNFGTLYDGPPKVNLMFVYTEIYLLSDWDFCVAHTTENVRLMEMEANFWFKLHERGSNGDTFDYL